MLTAIGLAAMVALCSAQYPTKHEVTSLPSVPKMPSKMYTGYIDAGVPPSGVGKMYFHYWMVESQGNPSTDPVVMWYNGGPGASSLFGLLQEFGPLLLNVNSYDEQYRKTGVPTPQPNPWTWSANVTLICIDSPPPIGFSFCTEQGPGGNGTSCGPWTDKTVFAANHKAHVTLFNEIIPEFKPNPFFMFGESYAGVYVPGFVNALLDDPIPGLNFKGFGIGDGWTGCIPAEGKPADYCVNLDNVGVFEYPNVNPGPFYDVQFFHGHAQFSQELYRQIAATCTEQELHSPNLSPACGKLINQMSEEIGGFYVYNLYNNCPQNQLKHGINNALKARKAMLRAASGQGQTTGACPGNAMPDWLLLKETLTALGAPLNTNFLNLDNGHGFNYTSDQTDIRFIYKKAIAKGLKVLVYEGDSDACGLQTSPIEDKFVPYFGQIGLAKTTTWRPWTTDGQQQMAGYVVCLINKLTPTQIEWNNGVARFVSIRGAGHLVPHNQPEEDHVVCLATSVPVFPMASNMRHITPYRLAMGIDTGTTWKANCVCVGVLGFVHAAIEQPMFTPVGAAITQTQVNGRRFRENLMDLYQRRALYRSLPAALVSSVPKSITHYHFLNLYVDNYLPGGDLGKATAGQAALAGVFTGVTETFITTPLNFVRYRMQRPEWGYRGTVDCVYKVQKSEGSLAFFKGLGPSLLRNPVCNGVAWYVLKTLDGVLPEFRGKWMVTGACGGVVGSFFSYPFEILRAAQTHNFDLKVTTSFSSIRRLYTGWVPGATQLTFSTAIMAAMAPNLKPLKQWLDLDTY